MPCATRGDLIDHSSYEVVEGLQCLESPALRLVDGSRLDGVEARQLANPPRLVGYVLFVEGGCTRGSHSLEEPLMPYSGRIRPVGSFRRHVEKRGRLSSAERRTMSVAFWASTSVW